MGKRPLAMPRSWEFPLEAYEKIKNKPRKIQRSKQPEQTGFPGQGRPRVEDACHRQGPGADS